MRAASRISIVTLLLLLAGTTRTGEASDVIVTCEDCKVGRPELGGLVQGFLEADAVVEATSLADTARRTSYSRLRIQRFRIDRVLVGRCRTREFDAAGIDGEFTAGARWIGGVLRQCEDSVACFRAVKLGADGELRYTIVDADWKPKGEPLFLPELERAVLDSATALGVDVFDAVRSVWLASVPGPAARTVMWGNRAGLCASCVLAVGRAVLVLGDSASRPRWVRCADPRERWGGSFHEGDQLLVPVATGAASDTVLAPSRWRSMLVQNGFAVRFDCSVDSLRREFERTGDRFRLLPAARGR